MPSSKPSFRFSSEALASAHVAAEREGLPLAEFVRRAVAARVTGTTSTTGPSLGTTAQLQTAVAALNAATERTEQISTDTKAQVNRLSKGIELLGDIATMLQSARS